MARYHGCRSPKRRGTLRGLAIDHAASGTKMTPGNGKARGSLLCLGTPCYLPYMSTEVWFRDPVYYAKELVECEVGLITWNRGVLTKRRIDPLGWADLYFGQAIPVRQILIGSQGSVEIGPGRGLDKPLAVYPTWTYGDEMAFLEDMVSKNVGDDMSACFDTSIPPDERPIFGQEHRVIITAIPPANTGPGRAIIRTLKLLQEDYPQCKIMVHGLYSYKYAFGMGFAAADMEPRTAAANGKLMLAAGAEMHYKHVQQKAHWITAMGMKPADMEIPRMRCIFNIKSAVWAGANYTSLHSPRSTKSSKPVDVDTPDEGYVPEAGRALPIRAKAKEGDKTLCNMCSLQLECKQFREGEVCSLTDSNTGELARFFGTRDSQHIIDGLSTLMQMQSRRLEYAAEEERILETLNPEVTKMVNSLFSQGVTLAKLLDPSLRGAGVKVQVGVINGQAAASVSSASSPTELVGSVMRSLEQQGIPRDKITPDLVMNTIKAMTNPEEKQRAIEGAVIAETES